MQKKHKLTQEDLDQNPHLIEQGYKVDDLVDPSVLKKELNPENDADLEGDKLEGDGQPHPGSVPSKPDKP